MSKPCFAALFAAISLHAALAGALFTPAAALGQNHDLPTIDYRVSGPTQRLEMIVNTTRILSMDFSVPRVLVQNPDVVTVQPLSRNQIQLSAQRPGITAVNVWDDKNEVHAITVRVFGDVRELQDTLNQLFPDANVRVQPVNSSLLLTGYVPRAEMIPWIVDVSREYFPKVINQIEVGGSQTIALHVKVMEVSRTKLRNLGIDWSVLTDGGDMLNLTTAQVGAGGTVRFGIIHAGDTFNSFLDVLRQNNLAKLMAEPTIVTTSGRPARFNSGGEIPVPITAGLGGTGIEFRQFGTIVDFLPIVLGDGNIRLEVRPQITEIDSSLRNGNTDVPGLRSRGVDTGVVMKAGQTLALAGLIQNRVEAENRGIPWLADIPYFGVPFRRVRETVNEVELLILVTPELVGPVDPHMVPPCGPGQFTASPDDHELYCRGYIEVPSCCPDGSCPMCQNHGAPLGPYAPSKSYEEIPSVVEPVAPPADPTGMRPPAPPRSQMIDVSRQRISDEPRQPQPQSRQPSTSYDNSRYAPAPIYSEEPSGSDAGTDRNSQNRNNSPRTSAQSNSTQPNSGPKIIGPIGYDVLN